MKRGKSNNLFDEACQHMVGGVNSPVRAFGSVGSTPIFIERAKGAKVWDVDGNEYIDFIQSWGPMILGHAPYDVVQSIQMAAMLGTSYGAPHQGEIDLAVAVKSRFPSMDMVRFVNSGTEAVMSAIRLARGYTNRSLVVKFDGCYHGHVDSLLVKAGSGVATLGISGSPGIPQEIAGTTLIAPLDDEASLNEIFAEHGENIAAIIIEPLPANNGLLVQRQEFLQHLRNLCDTHGSLLIFDEVISGFRFKQGGIGGTSQITPDLTTLGKIIGGGLPVGAYGGRKEIMDMVAPNGPVYQAGTLSGNPLAMAAGISTLAALDEQTYELLEELGAHFESLVTPVLAKHGNPMTFVRQGSLFWFSPGSDTPPRRADAIPSDAGQTYGPLHAALLSKGVMFAPSAYEIGFISSAHSKADLRKVANALDEALSEIGV